jgi:uncharacterized protein YndB with AHSA1/START domain
MQNEIRKSWYFSQPPQEVWEYLTNPELLEQWLGKTDIQPIVGHKFRFASPHGNDSHCEVLEVKPFTRLTYSWQKNSLKDKKPFNSKVEWTLTEKSGGTHLQLLHNGFVAIEDLNGHDNGWSAIVQKMEQLINTVKQ